MWLSSSLVTLPLAVFADTRPARGGRAVACNLHWPRPAWSVVFVVCTFLLGFLLPVLAIGLCYVLIVGKMRALALLAGWQQQKRSGKKITWLVLTVVAVFVLCWLPFYAVQLLNFSVTGLDATVNHVSLISHANSCANPILYGFLSDNFCRSFQRVLCLCCCLLDASGGADQEPLDYCATALKSRGGTGAPASRSPGNQNPAASRSPSPGPPPSEMPSPPTQRGHLQGICTTLQPSRSPVPDAPLRTTTFLHRHLLSAVFVQPQEHQSPSGFPSPQHADFQKDASMGVGPSEN